MADSWDEVEKTEKPKSDCCTKAEGLEGSSANSCRASKANVGCCKRVSGCCAGKSRSSGGGNEISILIS